MEGFLVDVGLLLVAVFEYAVWEQFDYDEWIAETVRIQGDYVSGMEDLKNILINAVNVCI